MKIQEVCKKTGYTKRTIHFYITEGLLAPVLDKPNGHYEFTMKDCEHLMLIRILRNAGFSIPSIRSLLNNPETIGYFLNQRIKAIQKEQKHLEQLSQSLNYMMENLPINPKFHDIFNLCENAGIPCFVDETNTTEYDTYDNIQVNRFLWGVFLPDTPLTEYQEFLWDKLNKITCNPNNEDFCRLSHFFNSLSSENVERVYAKQESHIKYVADLADCKEYSQELLHRINLFLNNSEDINDWKNHYELFIQPQIRIYDGEIGKLALEMSPLFVRYCNNIHVSCTLAYRWLMSENGKKLLKKLQDNLVGYIDLESCHHGELEVMANFRRTLLGKKW